jgi:aminopeptidase N
MISIAVGRFQKLGSDSDFSGRSMSVWSLPGAVPEDAETSVMILREAFRAWANFTGQELPEVGKVDMLVWNGDFQWSMSNLGFLLMDRFRTLWNAQTSTGSDLVRAAHIICHEMGHNWFGGLVQMLNDTMKGFLEESTTSYGEVSCTKAVLGALSESAIYTRLSAPPFDDSRGLHIGALTHALEILSRPRFAHLSIATSSQAWYTKGPAFLHMLEDYMDSTVQPVRFHLRAIACFLYALLICAEPPCEVLCCVG